MTTPRKRFRTVMDAKRKKQLAEALRRAMLLGLPMKDLERARKDTADVPLAILQGKLYMAAQVYVDVINSGAEARDQLYHLATMKHIVGERERAQVKVVPNWARA